MPEGALNPRTHDAATATRDVPHTLTTVETRVLQAVMPRAIERCYHFEKGIKRMRCMRIVSAGQ